LAWLLLFVLPLGGCGLYRPDPGSIERDMTGAVQKGATPAQVFEVLDARRLAHSPYRRDVTQGNNIEAEVRVTVKHAIVQPSYDVTFRFDDHDRLTGITVQYLGYVGL
jgi:hypothetical protein